MGKPDVTKGHSPSEIQESSLTILTPAGFRPCRSYFVTLVMLFIPRGCGRDL